MLVVDASAARRAPPSWRRWTSRRIRALSPRASPLAGARGLAIRHVDTTRLDAPFLTALTDAAPQAEVILVHADATDLARLFARSAELARRNDGPVPRCCWPTTGPSVTYAYAAEVLAAPLPDGAST